MENPAKPSIIQFTQPAVVLQLPSDLNLRLDLMPSKNPRGYNGFRFSISLRSQGRLTFSKDRGESNFDIIGAKKAYHGVDADRLPLSIHKNVDMQRC